MRQLSHDPGPEVALERSLELAGMAADPIATAGGRIRVGTASWTDPTMTKPGVFYPHGTKTAEDRLRYYAEQFSVVEVNTSYYAIPEGRTVENWIDRTPPGFVFDVKAHALMTGHPSEPNRLPPHIYRQLPDDLQSQSRLYRHQLPEEILDGIYDEFLYSIDALRQSNKLGAVFLQFPKWIVPSKEAYKLIDDNIKRLQVPIAVEFRHHSWMDTQHSDDSTALLARHHIAYVAVDEPQGFESSVPPVSAVTCKQLAVFRFHGRNGDTWEKKGTPPAEKFRYLYDQDELAEWVPEIQKASGQTSETHLIFNNCYANYGSTNALEMASLLHSAF